MSTARRCARARPPSRKSPARRSPPSKAFANSKHPLQKAWVEEQVPQCGYCQSGQIMQAAALLASNKKPTREQIIVAMDGNICRCGTYTRIIAAIQTRSGGLTMTTHIQALSRRSFLVSSGAAGIAVTFGTFDNMLPANAGGRFHDQCLGLHRQQRHRHDHVAGGGNGPRHHDRPAGLPRRGSRCRLGQGSRRDRARQREALRQSEVLRPHGHCRQPRRDRLLRDRAARRRTGAQDPGRQRRAHAEGAGIASSRPK